MKKVTSSLFKLVVFTVFQVSAVFAQYYYSDFQNETDLYRKSEIALELVEYFTRKDVDSLKVIAADLFLVDHENEIELTNVVGEYCLGVYFSRRGQVEKGIRYLKRSLLFFRSKGDFDNSALILNQLGNSYILKGEYVNAIQFYIKSLDIGLLAVDEEYQYVGKIGLSKSYFFLGDTMKGVSMMLQYKDDALKFSRFEAVANAYSILGMVELDRGDLDRSLEYFEKSIINGLKSESLMQLSHVYTNKAIVFFNLQQLDSSLFYFEKALETRVKLNHPRQITEAYFNLTSFYTEQGLYEQAKKPAHKCLQVALDNNLIVDEVDAYDLLNEIYTGLNETEKSKEIIEEQEKVKKKLDQKQELDKELIDYIQSLNEKSTYRLETRTKESKKPIWIIGFVILVFLAIGFFLKRNV